MLSLKMEEGDMQVHPTRIPVHGTGSPPSADIFSQGGIFLFWRISLIEELRLNPAS